MATLAISVILVCSTVLYANDTLATLGAGGLIPLKTTQISMESEDLEISVHQIKIRYVFRNSTNKEIAALVAFPLPELDGGAIYNEPMSLPVAGQTNFVGFSVTSNGNPVEVLTDVHAYIDDKEVTPKLIAAGLPVSVFLPDVSQAVAKLPDEKRRALEDDELISSAEFNPPLPGIGRWGWRAGWSMRVQFYWIEKFPANSTVELLQTYSPVVGGTFLLADNDGTSNLEPYCGTSDALRRISKEAIDQAPKERSVAVWIERQIDYILTTANNWRGPIGQFRLTVTTDGSSDILATCFPGLKRVSPTRYEFSRTNYRANSELKLLILQLAKQPGALGAPGSRPSGGR